MGRVFGPALERCWVQAPRIQIKERIKIARPIFDSKFPVYLQEGRKAFGPKATKNWADEAGSVKFNQGVDILIMLKKETAVIVKLVGFWYNQTESGQEKVIFKKESADG